MFESIKDQYPCELTIENNAINKTITLETRVYHQTRRRIPTFIVSYHAEEGCLKPGEMSVLHDAVLFPLTSAPIVFKSSAIEMKHPKAPMKLMDGDTLRVAAWAVASCNQKRQCKERISGQAAEHWVGHAQRQRNRGFCST